MCIVYVKREIPKNCTMKCKRFFLRSPHSVYIFSVLVVVVLSIVSRERVLARLSKWNRRYIDQQTIIKMLQFLPFWLMFLSFSCCSVCARVLARQFITFSLFSVVLSVLFRDHIFSLFCLLLFCLCSLLLHSNTFVFMPIFSPRFFSCYDLFLLKLENRNYMKNTSVLRAVQLG